MFDFVLILLVAAHLLAVNLAAAGPLVAVVEEWRARRYGDSEGDAAARTLARWSLWGAIVGVTLGLVAMAAVTLLPAMVDGDYLTALKQVPKARWWFTGAEVVFYLACMGAYVGLWTKLANHRVWHRLLAVLASTNLLYHFPALFTILAVVGTRPRLHQQPLTRGLYLQLLGDAEVLSRVVHVCLASFAVAGLALACIGGSRLTLDPPALAEATMKLPRAAMHGARWALACSLLQIPVGIWVLLALPAGQQERVLGGDWLGTLLLGISILAALALLHQLAMLSLGDVTLPRLKLTAALMVAIVLMMTGTLHVSRADKTVPARATLFNAGQARDTVR